MTLLKHSASILEEIVIVCATNQEVINVYLTYLIKWFAKYKVTHALLENFAEGKSPIGTRVNSYTLTQMNAVGARLFSRKGIW